MIRRLALATTFLGALSGCGLHPFQSKTVDYRDPLLSADSSTLVVVQRGGTVEQFVVVDGKVVGVLRSNTWTDVALPPGEHDVLLATSDDPQASAEVYGAYPCFHARANTLSGRAYYLRIGFRFGGKESAEAIKARSNATRASVKKDRQSAMDATEPAAASGDDFVRRLVDDPDPQPGQPANFSYRVIRKEEQLGRIGKGVLKATDRVELKSVPDAQARFDEIKGRIPATCLDGGETLESNQFVE